MALLAAPPLMAPSVVTRPVSTLMRKLWPVLPTMRKRSAAGLKSTVTMLPETMVSSFEFTDGGMLASVTAQLESPGALDAFALPLTQDKQTGLSVLRESAYYEKVSSGMANVISMLGMIYGDLADGRWTDARASNVIDGAAPFYNV